jgi:putative FmdB family regulatory protein
LPTYEYACAACDTRHEVQQKMTDDSLTVCPSCGDPSLRKIFTNVGVVFKGTGFYRNDSRDSGAKSSSSGGSSDSGSSGSGTSGSSDSGSGSSSTSTTPSAAPAAAPASSPSPKPSSTPAASSS